MSGLDFSRIKYLRGRVGRPRKLRTASMEFQRLWDRLDELRDDTGMDQGTFAEKCGFSRATYFDYASRGHAPFNTLEAMAARLKAKIQASVITSKLGLDTGHDVKPGDVMTDYLQPLADLLENVPEEYRQWAAGAMYKAAQDAIDRLPFGEPPAGHGRAHRRRSKR